MKGAKGRSGVTGTWVITENVDVPVKPMSEKEYDLEVELFGKDAADEDWRISNGEARSSA